jgi:DNA modification methylase
MFWQVENHYWIKEWVILCITIAETSWGNRWYGKTNPWNVGNNDRWDRVQYAFFETWLEKIGQTLTNKYLWKKQTLGCLSNDGSCVEPWDNGSRYATSESTWQKNMTACLSTIYWKIDPSSFSIRR